MNTNELGDLLRGYLTACTNTADDTWSQEEKIAEAKQAIYEALKAKTQEYPKIGYGQEYLGEEQAVPLEAINKMFGVNVNEPKESKND